MADPQAFLQAYTQASPPRTLTPVDYDPFAEKGDATGRKLTPVDHDPFSVEPARKGGGIGASIYHGSQGFYSGLADVLGAPVDLVNAGLAMAGMPVSDRPFLGSQNIKDIINAVNRPLKSLLGVNSPTVYNNINEVPEAYRPNARLGEVLGGNLPLVAAPIAGAARIGAAEAANAARASTGSAIKDIANQIIAQAANPRAFLASQAPVALGQGVGAYGAEIIAPGSPIAQIIGQLAGGGLTGLATAGGKQGTSAATNAANRLTEPFTTQTEAGAQVAAGRALRPVLEQAGENPEAIIARLKEPSAVGGLTAGERTGSRAITGVQDFLANENPDITNAIKQGQQTFQQNLQQGVRTAFAPGKQAALTKAAADWQRAFANRLDDLVTTAESKAQAALGPVQPNSPSQRTALNTKARDILEDALADARATERQLWSAVPKQTEIVPSNTAAAFDKIRAEMLPEESLNPLLERVMSRFNAATEGPTTSTVQTGLLDANGRPITRQVVTPPEPVTLGDAQNLRSNLLEEARGARANNDFKTARRLNAVADGLLDDMSSAGGGAVARARTFSYELNDRFSRSFAGDVLGTKATGADRIRPELTLERAVAGPPQQASQQLQELRTAANNPEMQGVQGDFLRSMSEKVINPATGRISPNQVDTFIRNNGSVLDQFPQYRRQLEAARDAERAFQSVTQQTADARKLADRQAAFSKVLAAGENPADAVAAAVNGANPVRDIGKLAALARSGGDEAVGGLRAAVLEHVMTPSNGKFTYGKAADMLNSPLSPNGPSLLQSLRKSGVINATQHARIDALIGQGLANEASQVSGIKINAFGTEPGTLAKAAARIIGARLASESGLGHGGAGASLQIAQIGANLAEKMFAKLPANQAKLAMAKALSAEDPSALISILENTGAAASGGMAKLDEPAVKALALLRAAIPHGQTQFVPEDLSAYDVPQPPVIYRRR